MSAYTEESYENALIELFTDTLGYDHVYGPDVERDRHSPLYDSVLEDSIRHLNPKAASSAIDEALLKLRNFENAGKLGDKNSYIVANQWTFIENSNKRPDILFFLNGLPICLFELKSPSREQTDASEAYTQIRNYMHEIPSMFIYNCICVMSDQLSVLYS
nr:type I restriction endonuclease subunit R [Treponema sp.]